MSGRPCCCPALTVASTEPDPEDCLSSDSRQLIRSRSGRDRRCVTRGSAMRFPKALAFAAMFLLLGAVGFGGGEPRTEHFIITEAPTTRSWPTAATSSFGRNTP
jgi:hypothetical protein